MTETQHGTDHDDAALAQQAPPITVRVREACRLTGIGRSKLYELIKAGEIETIKVGHMTLIPMASLTGLLEASKVTGKSGTNAANAAGQFTKSH